jgi:hypothetical protein
MTNCSKKSGREIFADGGEVLEDLFAGRVGAEPFCKFLGDEFAGFARDSVGRFDWNQIKLC